MIKNDRYPSVFKPLTIRGVTIKNRLQYAPTVVLKCSPEGDVTKEMIDYVAWQAKTGVGYITIGNTPVIHENSSAWLCEMNVTKDQCIHGMAKLVDAARNHGAELSVELSHAGRGSTVVSDDSPALAPSFRPLLGFTENLKVMDRADMDYIISCYTDCAERCKKAGFRMIMIHCAHNNLLAQFLSPDSNIRTDGYGGSIENRMRFPLEVLSAVRQTIGEDVVLEMRVSATEDTQGGLEMPDSLTFMEKAQEYVDIIHISRGSIFTLAGAYTIPSYLKGRLLNVDFAAEAKKSLHVPVAVVGNITSLTEAEAIISSGKADIVAMAKAYMADGEIIKKSLVGKSGDVRPCTRCDHCGNHNTYGISMKCAVNPDLGCWDEVAPVSPAQRKRVMVIGGGPGGMMAAQTLIRRGHAVTLYEKTGSLGGLLRDATVAPFKEYLRLYLEWMVRETEKCGAEIQLNEKITPELVAEENPDAIIVATGSNYLYPDIPGLELGQVKRVMDVEHHLVDVGQSVIVCGGGIAGAECALALAMEGKQVRIIDQIPADSFCGEMAAFNRLDLMDHLERYGVELIGGHRIKAFTDEGMVTILEGEKQIFPADTYVLALGVKPDNALGLELMKQYPADVYMVGDCVCRGRNFFHANQEAYHAAMNI